MGIASGDRPIECPAYGLNHSERGQRYAQAVAYFRQFLQAGPLWVESKLGCVQAADLLPKPSTGAIPWVVTGASGQSLGWLADL